MKGRRDERRKKRVCLKDRGFPCISSVRCRVTAKMLMMYEMRARESTKERCVCACVCTLVKANENTPDQAWLWSTASSLSCCSVTYAFEVFNVHEPWPKPMTLFFLQLSLYTRRYSWRAVMKMTAYSGEDVATLCTGLQFKCSVCN